MTRTAARPVAIMAFIAGALIPSSFIFRSYGVGAAFSMLAFVLTLAVFSMLSSAAGGLPGSGFLRAGFICGLASLVLTFLVPFVGLVELGSAIGTLLWPVALVLVAIGLLRTRLVPPWTAALCGAWGLLVAARDVVALWIPPLPQGAEIAILVVPAVIGTVFSVALGVVVLTAPNESQ